MTHCSKPYPGPVVTKHHQSPDAAWLPSTARLCPEYPGAEFLFAFPFQRACGCYYTCWCSVSLTSHLKHHQVLSGIQPTSISFICHVLLSASKQTAKRGQSRDFSNVNVSCKLLLKLRRVIQNACWCLPSPLSKVIVFYKSLLFSVSLQVLSGVVAFIFLLPSIVAGNK